ncbi:hypothetical protein [Morganella morganii]|uniref:hypothetical protein n=1 Tax=Morganella morganii TaxID=582 RepID=UPI0013B41E07|nr:hypothetical protein [Morganella morganii]
MYTKNVLTALVFSSLTCAGAFAATAPAPNAGKVTLMGTISSVTCTVDINGTAGGTTVDTGVHTVGAFTTVNGLATSPLVPMVVDLKNCTTPNPVGDYDIATDGDLIITGNVAANGNNNIFVGSDTKTGFMVLKEGGSSSSDAVQNLEKVNKPLGTGNDSLIYTYKVGMASMVATPAAGVYTAPISISYVTP